MYCTFVEKCVFCDKTSILACKKTGNVVLIFISSVLFLTFLFFVRSFVQTYNEKRVVKVIGKVFKFLVILSSFLISTNNYDKKFLLMVCEM